MKEGDESFELRSEEVNEILTNVPHWLIRCGSFIVFSILIIVFFLSWLIKYPDVITTQIVITTVVPPQKLIAKTSGKIDKILIHDKTTVFKDSPIAVLENSANYKDVFLLKKIIDSINIGSEDFPFEKLKSLQLGDIENSFGQFQKEYIAYKLNIEQKPYKIERVTQQLEVIQLNERIGLLESQKNINQNELKLQNIDLERFESLYKKGIISTQEIEKHRLQYLQSQKSYKSLLSSISQLKSSLNELQGNSKVTKINESKENRILEYNMIQSFYNLKRVVKEWDLNYVFRSSINGKVTFLQLWSDNQTVNIGDAVFAIIPIKGSNYVGKLKATAQNSGKIKIGQKVNIRLANYPSEEFGVIEGTIQAISLTPDKDGYLLIDVSLKRGLITSYNKKVLFQQEMTGIADIITQDLRLIERFLFQIKGKLNS